MSVISRWEALVQVNDYAALETPLAEGAEAGIVDPTKMVRSALQNAASIAGLLLTAEALITEKPEKKGTSLPADSEY